MLHPIMRVCEVVEGHRAAFRLQFDDHFLLDLDNTSEVIIGGFGGVVKVFKMIHILFRIVRRALLGGSSCTEFFRVFICLFSD